MLAGDGMPWMNAVDVGGPAVPPPAAIPPSTTTPHDMMMARTTVTNPDCTSTLPKYKTKTNGLPPLVIVDPAVTPSTPTTPPPEEPMGAGTMPSAPVSAAVAVRRRRRAMMSAKLTSQGLRSPVADEEGFQRIVTEAAARMHLRFSTDHQRDTRRATALRGHRVSAAF